MKRKKSDGEVSDKRPKNEPKSTEVPLTPESSTSTTDIGPSFPPTYTSTSTLAESSSSTTDSFSSESKLSDSTAESTSSVGPQLPAHLLKKGAEEGSDDDDDEKKDQKEKSQSDGKNSFVRFGVASSAGQAVGVGEKSNQDRSVVEYALNGNVKMDLFGIFDGHGEKGHEVSEYVSKHLSDFLCQELVQLEKEKLEKLESDEGKVKEIITLAIKKLAADLKVKNTNKTLDSSKSGTTAVFGLRIEKKVFLSNIGDSRCVWAKRLHVGKDEDPPQLEAIQATVDHKPGNPEEKKKNY